MESEVTIKDYIPVGNYILLKPICLNPSPLVPIEMQEKNAFEIISFGSAYIPEEDLKIGDKVIVIEYDNKKEGILLTIENNEYWAYPPWAIVAKIKENEKE